VIGTHADEIGIESLEPLVDKDIWAVLCCSILRKQSTAHCAEATMMTSTLLARSCLISSISSSGSSFEDEIKAVYLLASLNRDCFRDFCKKGVQQIRNH
jgi:hypothetical protein